MIRSAPIKEKLVTKPHPGGVAGALMSLDEVAARMWSARNDPRVRAWTTQELDKGGRPTGARAKAQVVLDAYRKKVPYVSDPVKTEAMYSPVQTLCLDDGGLCVVGGDCDDAAITVGACLLSIGIPVQVVGASYKAPIDQPVHVLIQFQDDFGNWVQADPTSTYPVGNVHEPARTWIVDPDKGVGAHGLPGGDFVGVGHAPQGLGALPVYVTLLTRLVTQDLPALQAAWASVQAAINSESYSDPCGGLGGPASLVSSLQDISDQACTLAHNAATAALGYVESCGGAGSSNYTNAESATLEACSLKYAWAGPNFGPYGTVFVTGNAQATCLDTSFTSAVGAQIGAAAYAVAQAQVAAQACAVARTLASKRGAIRSVPHVVPSPEIFAMGEWEGLSRGGAPLGLGLVLPGDVLAYRALWNSYVLDTARVCHSCSVNFGTMASTQADASLKTWLTSYAQTLQDQSDLLVKEWNTYAGQTDAFIVLHGASILQSYQDIVLDAGDVRGLITTATVSCALTYTNTQGQIVQAAPGADPNVQTQVIARIEGLGILASGVLQILVEGTGASLEAAGSAAQWAAKQVGNVTSALSSSGFWIAVTAVAGAVVVYEVWPRSR